MKESLYVTWTQSTPKAIVMNELIPFLQYAKAHNYDFFWGTKVNDDENVSLHEIAEKAYKFEVTRKHPVLFIDEGLTWDCESSLNGWEFSLFLQTCQQKNFKPIAFRERLKHGTLTIF